MVEVKQFDTVKFHYTGRLADGTVFDSSRDSDPLTVKVGEGRIPLGLERALIGMSPGDSKKELLAPEEAYGERRDDLVVEVEKDALPEGLEPQVGEPLTVKDAEGNQYPVTVADISDEAVKLDANHPLAGMELEFEIELLDVT